MPQRECYIKMHSALLLMAVTMFLSIEWSKLLLCNNQKRYRIAGNFRRRKSFANFAVLWLFAKVFYTKLGDMLSFGTARVSNPWKFSPRKSYFSPICESFVPWKFLAMQWRFHSQCGNNNVLLFVEACAYQCSKHWMPIAAQHILQCRCVHEAHPTCKYVW